MSLFSTKDLTLMLLEAKQKCKEEFKAGGKAYTVETVNFFDLQNENPTASLGNISINKKGIFFEAVLTNKYLYITIENIIKADYITRRQINKDVTLSRQLGYGAFGFGITKKSKEEQNFLIINYKEKGNEKNIAFEAKEANSLAGEVIKVKQQYKDESPEIAGDTQLAIDIIDLIKKLSELKDQGILTEDEFQKKKLELLGRI